ncbi:MAG: AIR synthase-related protein, partial [Lysobacteraceae bacterium]
SGRNWASYGTHIQLDEQISDIDRALLCDPQTSGGLLVSCAADSLDEVLAIFQRHDFTSASVIGRVEAGEPGVVLTA